MLQLTHIALSQYGVTEVKGKVHNPKILNYFKAMGKAWVTTDETAWCSAFMNWVALEGKKIPSYKLTARSWLGVGTKVMVPKINDVVIFWRGKRSGWKGHVGLFIGYTEDRRYIYVLGGNQNNQVSIKAYPSYRLLGFRRLDSLNS